MLSDAACLDALEEQGYFVLPGALAADECRAIRDFMDRTIAAGHVKDPGRGSSEFHHRICHPIEDPIAVTFAEHPLLNRIATLCLGAQNLRLRQQMFLLTQPCGKPGPARADGWHTDTLFLPGEWYDTPRKAFIQVFCYATAVRPGGAATMVVPGSHHKTLAAAAAANPRTEEERWRVAGQIARSVDLADAVELTCEAGDVVFFSPMLLHSGSNNVTDHPRYAFHASYHDASASRIRHLPAPVFYDTFPASMERVISPALRPLLER